MSNLKQVKPQTVFHFFKQISAIPHGSGNMDAISEYCMDFAKQRGLKAQRDQANNVIIFKAATRGYEAAQPIILQGHLDMVCQKTPQSAIDFEKDGLELLVDGDFVTANGTTLGADNGIAVAMVLSILDRDDLAHPAIEAVFTTDEEIGMIGATQLDMSLLQAKRMINLDAEEEDTLTVSCAGGSDVRVFVPLERLQCNGTEVTVAISGLKGGHSGVEIDKGRVNANLLAGRFLNHMRRLAEFDLISINGGDKSNAIPLCCEMRLVARKTSTFLDEAERYLATIQKEIAEREPAFSYTINTGAQKEHSVLTPKLRDSILFALLCTPNGIQDMSAEIAGLVETSLNLGVLQTGEDELFFQFALRSNKQSALEFLEEKVTAFFACLPCRVEVSGHYPPWEFRENSALQALYKELYRQAFGKEVKVAAIHAGLECGLFSSKIEGLDCIAIGPQLYDVHTVHEKMSVSSVERMYELLLSLLRHCKD